MKILLIITGLLTAITVIAFLIPSFDERRKGVVAKNSLAMPKINFKPQKLINILVILAIAGGIWWATKHHFFDVPVKAPAVIHEYQLSAGQTLDTKLDTNRGTVLRFWASKPFHIVNVVGDNPSKTIGEYQRPSGESLCQISDPSGPFVIRGDFDDTVVRISEVR